jgi:LysR family glycine cleavage system transcriptional activator
MVIDAAIRGRGIACVPKVLVEEELADGRLIIPIAREVDSAGGYHMLYRRSRKHSRPLSDLRQWLKSAASAAP